MVTIMSALSICLPPRKIAQFFYFDNIIFIPVLQVPGAIRVGAHLLIDGRLATRDSASCQRKSV